MVLKQFLFLLFMAYSNNAAKILAICPTPAFSHQKLFQTIMKALVAKGHEVTVIGTDPLKIMVLKQFLFLLFMAYSNNAAKILAICPTPAFSHQKLFQTIMKALVAKGHEVTVIGTDPLKEPIANYTDIDISFSYKFHRNEHDFEGLIYQSPYQFASFQMYIQAEMADHQLSSPQLQEFIRSNKIKYDLVILEELLYPCYYGLVHHVGSPPVIGLTPGPLLWTVSDAFAVPDNPSYVPNLILFSTDKMSFFERLQNTFFWLYIRYKVYTEMYPANERIMRKHFGSSPPSIIEAHHNKSLILIGSNWLFHYPLPLPPATVTFHSAILKTSPEPLPKHLEEFISDAPNGVIYMSFGSNIHSAQLPNEKLQAFLDAFSQLPQKVLWKWESDDLPRHTPNIKFEKWLPQQDILAHQNIKLFITHCGLQSLHEAVHHAVPMLAFPFFGDQAYNAKKVHTEKIGLQMSILDVSKDILLDAINKILHDASFRNSMKSFSTLSRDTPENAVEKAVWWTEYVLRHKGARHLRSAALDLYWYQHMLLDVLAFIILSVSGILCFLFFIIRTVCIYFSRKHNLK